MASRQSFAVSHSFLVVAISWLALTQSSVAVSAVPVDLFTDDECTYPSPVNPNITAPLNTCIVTPGLFSLQAPNFACADGTEVQFLVYGSGACHAGDGFRWTGTDCQENSPDAVAGFVAYCGATEQLQISATTTIPVVSDILTATTATASETTAVSSAATDSSASSSATTESTTMSSSATEATRTTSSAAVVTTTTPTRSATPTTSQSSGATNTSPLGIPSVVLALVALFVTLG